MYASINVKCPEQANVQRQKVDRRWPGAGDGGMGNVSHGCGVSF